MEFDRFEVDAPLFRGFSWFPASLLMIDIRECKVLAGGIPDGIGDTAHLSTIINVGGRDVQGQQMTEVYPMPEEASGRVCVWRRHNRRAGRIPV
jgi:hypothetical protein